MRVSFVMSRAIHAMTALAGRTPVGARIALKTACLEHFEVVRCARLHVAQRLETMPVSCGSRSIERSEQCSIVHANIALRRTLTSLTYSMCPITDGSG
jgi:hypothetical protein